MDSDNENVMGNLANENNFGSSRNPNRAKAHSRAYSALVSNDIGVQLAVTELATLVRTPVESSFSFSGTGLGVSEFNSGGTSNLESPFDDNSLKNLASANFSTESLSATPMAPPPMNYSMGLGLGVGSPYTSRRYSNNSLSNSPLLPPSTSAASKRHSTGANNSNPNNSINNNNNNNSNTSNNTSNGRLQRPKSAIFMMDSNSFAISEDGSPIQDAIDNTPRARSSFIFGNTNRNSTAAQAYVPTAPIAPPTRPNGFTFGGSTTPRDNNSRSNSRSSSPVRGMSPSRYGRSMSPIRKPVHGAHGSIGGVGDIGRSTSPVRYQPFNFQPQEVMLNPNGSTASLLVKPAHRKGHKYKHSSVSMNLFQEPPPAIKNLQSQLLNISDLYPIPTFKESINSISHSQRLKLFWSLGHLSLSVIVFMVGMKYRLPTLLTLAHLVFYDALGSLVIVFVDIMSNFEVWNSSSIQYPFGLGRLEVLVGFALSTSLIMVGLDLISHSVEEFVIELAVGHLEAVSDHLGLHHIHGDHEPGLGIHENWFVYEAILFLSIAVTLISSNYILFYDRITKMISNQNDSMSGSEKSSNINTGILEGSILTETTSFWNLVIGYWNVMSRNPTHLLTLVYSTYLIFAPILPTQLGLDLDIDLNEATTLVVALLLCYNGWKIAKSLGGILLLSYPYSDYQYLVLKLTIADKVEQLSCFKQTYSIDRLFITKFNYELFVVGVRINMRGGSNEEESIIRFEISRIINASIDRVVSGRKNKVEITIDIDRY